MLVRVLGACETCGQTTTVDASSKEEGIILLNNCHGTTYHHPFAGKTFSEDVIKDPRDIPPAVPKAPPKKKGDKNGKRRKNGKGDADDVFISRH